MAYGGKNESPDKMRVRATFYALLGRLLWTTSHIVIASEDCGDIIFLLSMGVSPLNIIACDINPMARKAASRYGVVVSPYPTVQDTVQWALSDGRRIGSVNVDLCESLLTTAPVISTVYEKLKFAGIKCWLALTFNRGRDARVLKQYLGHDSDTARQLYTKQYIELDPDKKEKYVSLCKSDKGSPMNVYMWGIKGRQGRKRRVQVFPPETPSVHSVGKYVHRTVGRTLSRRMKNILGKIVVENNTNKEFYLGIYFQAPHLYFNERLTQQEVADTLGRSQSCISQVLRRFQAEYR